MNIMQICAKQSIGSCRLEDIYLLLCHLVFYNLSTTVLDFMSLQISTVSFYGLLVALSPDHASIY